MLGHHGDFPTIPPEASQTDCVLVKEHPVRLP